MKNLFADIVKFAEKQRHANEVIDRVVAEESASPFQQRQDEHARLMRAIGITLEDQAAILKESTANVCDFYVKVAVAVERHAHKDKRIDDEIADALTILEETFEEKDGQLESSFEETKHNIRHAPNTKTCERAMKTALKLLDDIEENYRRFYQKSMETSKAHPKRVRWPCECLSLFVCFNSIQSLPLLFSIYLSIYATLSDLIQSIYLSIYATRSDLIQSIYLSICLFFYLHNILLHFLLPKLSHLPHSPISPGIRRRIQFHPSFLQYL